MAKDDTSTLNTPLWRWALGILSLLITALVMWPTLGNGFVNWDDGDNIENNPYIRTLDGTAISDVFGEDQINGAYMPLTQVSWMLDYASAEKDATGKPGAAPFHRTNLLLHLLNVLLVYLLAYRLSGNSLVAAFTALLFGIHPMHLEAVAWATSRKDVLMGAFFLGGLLLYQRALDKAGEDGRPSTLRQVLVAALFFAALLSKGVAIVFPFALLLLDWFAGRGKDWKRMLLEKTSLFAASLVFALLAFMGQREGQAMGELGDISILESLLIGCYGLVNYLIEAIVPFRLSAFHPYPYIEASDMPAWLYAMPLLTLLFFALVYWRLRRNRILLFGLGFFLLCLLPVLQFLPFSIAAFAERFTYLPYFGLFFAAAMGMHWLAGRYGKLVWGAPVLLLGIYGVLTFGHAKTWENGGTMWSNVIEQYPEGHFGYGNRASFYMEEGKMDLALADLEKSIALNPKFSYAYNNRGRIKQGRGDLDAAFGDYDRAIGLNPDLGEAWLNRGVIHLNRGVFDRAIGDFDRAADLLGENPLPYYNRGLAKGMSGDPVGGLPDFDRAIELEPGNPVFFKDRGISQMLGGRAREAEADFSKATELDPNYGEAWFRRSLCRVQAGDTTTAIRYAEEAAAKGYRIDPAYLEALR